MDSSELMSVVSVCVVSIELVGVGFCVFNICCLAINNQFYILTIMFGSSTQCGRNLCTGARVTYFNPQPPPGG